MMPTSPDPDRERAELDTIRSELFARIDDERGLRVRVRELPTRVRRAALVLWVLGWIALGVPGWDPETLLFGGVALALGWLSLRPVHRPPLPRGLELCLLGVTLVVAVLLSLAGSGPPVGASAHLMCLVSGTAIALAILSLWWLLSRGAVGFYAFAAAACGGMAANAFLSARCPNTNPVHLVLAHLSVLGLAIIVGWAASRRRA